MTKALSKGGQQEIVMEIESHMYESLQKTSSESEIDALLATLEKLGEPEDFLVEMVADRKMEEAAESGNPLHLLQAFRMNIGKGIGHVLLAILYFFTFIFSLLIPLKLIFPHNVGYFKQANDFVFFGYLSDHEASMEILGWWFIPLVMGVVVLLYFSIVSLLRLLVKRT